MPPTGRPPGRPLTELELRHLRLLREIYEQAKQYATVYEERFEDSVLDCRESGASARGMGDVLGVSSTTIQKWTDKAKTRRDHE